MGQRRRDHPRRQERLRVGRRVGREFTPTRTQMVGRSERRHQQFWKSVQSIEHSPSLPTPEGLIMQLANHLPLPCAHEVVACTIRRCSWEENQMGVFCFAFWCAGVYKKKWCHVSTSCHLLRQHPVVFSSISRETQKRFRHFFLLLLLILGLRSDAQMRAL